MNFKPALVLVATVTVASGLVACGSSSSNQGTTGETRASLHRAKSCGDLLGDLKADAELKLNQGIDRQILFVQTCIARNGDAQCAYAGGGGYGLATPAEVGSSNTGAPAPAAGASSSSSGGTGAAPATDKAASYSQTNVQVKGVDEADIVKTDGASLFLIHGSKLEVLHAWPANELKESSSIDIEGSPSEMFVADGKAVVYSTVNGVDIFAAAGVTPKQSYQDYYYAPYGGGGVSGGAVAVDAPAVPPSYTPGPYVPLTKVTVLDMTGAAPSVLREIYFEGSYLDSRRVDTHVRTVLQGAPHGPKIYYGYYDLASAQANGAPTPNASPQTGTQAIQQLEQLRAANRAILEASQLSDWIPYTFVKDGAAVHAQTVACPDFYIPSVGSTEAGLTEIASIDLANPAAPPRETAILGAAQTVYGSADTLYLAANAWVEPPFAWQDNSGPVAVGGGSTGGGTAAPPPSTGGAPAPIGTASLKPRTGTTTSVITPWPTNKTHVHKFEFTTDPQFPNYVASGTVVGNLKDQYSLDDKDGFLRVATTESRMYVDSNGLYVSPTFPGSTGPLDHPSQVNHLFVLGVNGPWLDTVGNAGDLAPNESIYSVRFVGPKGYVTTFRQVDPLFVFDLTVPSNPVKLAELTIPGFSEYMHPIDDGHLLTIGRATTSTGRASSLQLRIFDVTNAAAPAIAQEFTYSASEYGQSEAEYDPKAFTYFDDKKLLAFPYFAYSSTGMRSSLEVFRVDLAGGFTKLGTVDQTPLVSKNPTGFYCGYYGPEVRRGVFLENFVFSISYGGVVAKDSNDLAAPGVTLALPTPVANTGYGPVCAAP